MDRLTPPITPSILISHGDYTQIVRLQRIAQELTLRLARHPDDGKLEALLDDVLDRLREAEKAEQVRP